VSVDYWDWLMHRARVQATLYGERAQVRAGLLPDRAARVTGSRWTYVVMAPERWVEPKDWYEARLRTHVARVLGWTLGGMA
jgi:hypothetical protein